MHLTHLKIMVLFYSVQNKMGKNYGFRVLVILLICMLVIWMHSVCKILSRCMYTSCSSLYACCIWTKINLLKRNFFFLRNFVAITTSSQTFEWPSLILSFIHPFIRHIFILHLQCLLGICQKPGTREVLTACLELTFSWK